MACLLYERVLNKDSYQLIINVFPDKEDRDNLIHRLKLKPSENQFVVDCNLLISPTASPVRHPHQQFNDDDNNSHDKNTKGHTTDNNSNNNNNHNGDKNTIIIIIMIINDMITTMIRR